MFMCIVTLLILPRIAVGTTPRAETAKGVSGKCRVNEPKDQHDGEADVVPDDNEVGHRKPFYFKPCYLKTYNPLDTILGRQLIPNYANQILDLGTVAGLPHGSWIHIYLYIGCKGRKVRRHRSRWDNPSGEIRWDNPSES